MIRRIAKDYQLKTNISLISEPKQNIKICFFITSRNSNLKNPPQNSNLTDFNSPQNNNKEFLSLSVLWDSKAVKVLNSNVKEVIMQRVNEKWDLFKNPSMRLENQIRWLVTLWIQICKTI